MLRATAKRPKGLAPSSRSLKRRCAKCINPSSLKIFPLIATPLAKIDSHKRSSMDSYSETLERIYSLRGGMIDLRLERMERALALWDHPENKFPSIHIAGTNGKGSTAAMLHRMLSLAGYRTALYTSPHLVSFTERIRIGDKEISHDDVVGLAAEIWQRTAAADVALTFFEFITVMAFVYF